MQTFLIKTYNPEKKVVSVDRFRVLQELLDYPKRYEIQSLTDSTRKGNVIYDVSVNNKGDWKILEQRSVPNPQSLIGGRTVEFFIVDDPNITVELITEEMMPYCVYMEPELTENEDYRKVVSTGAHSQIAYQLLDPGTDVGDEIHMTTDQFVYVQQGEGRVDMTIGTTKYSYALQPDVAFHIPAKTKHNILNLGLVPMKFFTVYGGTVLHDAGLTQRLKSASE